MTEIVEIALPSGERISIEVTRRRQKRIVLRITAGVPKMSAPTRVPVAQIRKFAEDKAAWIDMHIRKARERAADESFKLWGVSYDKVVAEGGKRGVAIVDNVAFINTGTKNYQYAVNEFYKAQLRELLARELPYWQRVTGCVSEVKRVVLTNAKSYWGNCNKRTGTIRFSSMLAKRSVDEARYVIVHELCHFKHPNHSAAFYAEVERYMPNYKVWRKKLKDK